ncbi:MAG: hypothetical protein A3G75_16250 [Verrucomicrobia bacterium RIFCSPLOWO2_12_FULL_64_8]|nr:MAG: hypothetical protein A3G75_16250 [Verrucomicrobia bacterium RIFCSPLOWO2_12_FULL_64_8]
MNLFSRNLCFILLSGALVLAGCKIKPRPAPTDTLAGSQTGGITVAPVPISDVGTAPGIVPRPPGDTGILEDENTIRGLLQPVYFDFDQTAIKTSERGKVQEALKYLQANPPRRLLLEGHCDWRGTAEYNLGLGDRRATAVKEFLKYLSVSNDKLESLSKGDLDAKENAAEDVMAKDRRVDFVILKK